jgi:hypothetical protein
MHELKLLVDRLEKAEQDIKDWFEANVQPKLDEGKTVDEAIELQNSVVYFCRDAEGVSRAMPSYIFGQFSIKVLELPYEVKDDR